VRLIVYPRLITLIPAYNPHTTHHI
jgi:hypothetical protein